jgi:hypothetical protein
VTPGKFAAQSSMLSPENAKHLAFSTLILATLAISLAEVVY